MEGRTDLTAECLADLPGVGIPALRGQWCHSCSNARCSWARSQGGKTLWEDRMKNQEDRLFNPRRDDVAWIRDQDFRDARDDGPKVVVPVNWSTPRVDGRDVVISVGGTIRIPRSLDAKAPPENPTQKEGSDGKR